MAFLTAIAMEGEANAASTVAALLGNSDAAHSLRLAKENFRSISFAALEPDDLLKNKTHDGSKNELYEKTKRARLGSCDAFLSHSWADDGRKKYRALRRWAIEFKIKNGRDPEIWLDKACIDQNNIADDLLCLPIFTAGCSTLLIVAGPTYISRLWCIIEVFVFLKMGGDVSRITIIPIDMTDDQAKEMFEKIDTSKSKCWLESDRQKLLGIVEQGFGNFTQFNNMMRHVFKNRVTSGNVYGSMRRQSSARKQSKHEPSTVPIESSSTRKIIIESAAGYQEGSQPILLVLDLESSTKIEEIEAQTKARIQESLKCNTQPHVVLFYNGMRLRSSYTLENYEIQNNETLRLVFRPRSTIEIFVESSNLEYGLGEPNTLSLSMGLSDTVFDLKTAIHEQTSTAFEGMSLQYEDKCLLDGQFLFDCGVQDQSTLQLVTNECEDADRKNSILINIDRFDGKPVKIHCDCNETISSIKILIEKKTDVPVKHQRLFHISKARAAILDDDKSLMNYNLRHGSTVYLLEQKADVPFWMNQIDLAKQEADVWKRQAELLEQKLHRAQKHLENANLPILD